MYFLCSVFLVPLHSLQGKCCDSSDSSNRTDVADYVIVGVGTAGAVMAKKLSDDKKTSVIALHNGENLNADPDITLSKNALTTIFSALAGIPPFSLTGETTNQPFADNQTFSWAMGLPFGGTSSVMQGLIAGEPMRSMLDGKQ